MTNFEKHFKNANIRELAKRIAEGISSDSCDYCKHNEEDCRGIPCRNIEDAEIIEMWLESEAKE